MRYLVPIFLSVTALATLSCGKKTGAGVAVDAAFARLVPPDTKVLAAIRVDDLKSTALYKRHQSQLDIPMLDAFSERVGVDPRRDISDALAAWNGKRTVVMARGRFAVSDVQKKLAALGTPRNKYKDYTLFGSGSASFVFMKKAVAVSGSPEALRAIIDLSNAGGGAVPQELEQRLHALPKGDQIWLVSRGGLPFVEIPMRSELESALSNIVAFVNGSSLAIGVDSGTHLQIEVFCISEAGAQRVRDAFRGGIAIGRLMAKDNQIDLMRLYDSILVDQAGEVVSVRADLPQDLTDKLLEYLPQLTRRVG
ncbi:MAG: hypothetical protein WB992_02030 [Bryobacteraceae bacterium]